jgi:hypothetical protein
MKFLMFTLFDVAKTVEVAQAADKVSKTPGQKTTAQYVCQGMAFNGQPQNTTLAIAVVDAESNEALAASQYPLALAGASTWAVPVLEMRAGGTATAEKKYRK